MDAQGGVSRLLNRIMWSESQRIDHVPVPALWDAETKRVVPNAGDDLMKMLNSEFDDLPRATSTCIHRPSGRKSIKLMAYSIQT